MIIIKHLGDITQIKGYEAPTVDCIVGGSPCQDLSVAGKRAGLAGARSGLYMEQIRIIKEMREYDRNNGRTGVDIRPRYMVWENVPGAFSTNKGQDFAAVLEEAIRVAEPEAPNVDVPEKGWPTSGCFYDEMGKWSVAWRVMDSQYWGVPQRRRRICLVADFNGLNAPKIVFGEAEHHGETERGGGDPSLTNIGVRSQSQVQSVTEGLPGNPDESQPQGQETAGDARESIGGADIQPIAFQWQAGAEANLCIGDNLWPSLSCTRVPAVASAVQGSARNSCTILNPNDSQGNQITDGTGDGIYPTLRGCGGAGYQQGYVFTVDQGGGKSSVSTYEGVSPTITRTNDGAPAVVYGISNCVGVDSYNLCTTGDVARTLAASRSDNEHLPVVAYTYDARGNGDGQKCATPTGDHQNRVTDYTSVVLEPASFYPQMKAESQCFRQDGVSNTLVNGTNPGFQNAIVEPIAIDRAFFNQGINAQYEPQLQEDGTVSTLVSAVRHIVRRLTPLECERLQGFPDGWTDIGEWVDSNGKKHKEADSPRYKALGNSIALPPWKWVLKRLCACYERDATMASLFDGIGGFPLIWEQLNGKGSCLWASEIEEFPIAVTKARFGE